MPYILMLIGILTMCVPEDASLMRFAIQGAFGLALFICGVMLALEDYETAR